MAKSKRLVNRASSTGRNRWFPSGEQSSREVVFGVIQKKDNRNLPFFSKVALSSVKKQLKRMGIETKFNWIARE